MEREVDCALGTLLVLSIRAGHLNKLMRVKCAKKHPSVPMHFMAVARYRSGPCLWSQT